MSARDLRVGVREMKRARGGARVVILLREGSRTILVPGDPRGETEACAASRDEAHARPQAQDRIEDGARRSRQGASIERLGIVRAPPAPKEARAVRLPLDRRLDPAVETQDVEGPEILIARRSRAAMREERRALPCPSRLHEEFAERRMRHVLRNRPEGDLRVARDLDLARPLAPVLESDPADLHVILGRDADFEPGLDLVVPAPEDRSLGQEVDDVLVRLAAHWLIRSRPYVSRVDISKIEELAARIRRGVVAPPGYGAVLVQTRAPARVRHDRNVRAVAEDVRARIGRVRRPKAARRHGHHGGRGVGFLRGAGVDDRGLSRHPLLEQQLGGLHPGVAVKALDHHAVQEGVRDGDERHALVVREVRLDDVARGLRVAFVRGHAAIRMVEGLVKAPGAARPFVGKPPEVGDRGGGIHERGESGRIRGDDELVSQASLEPETRNAEGLVLVGALAVRERVRRFGDSPRHAARLRIGPLALHDHAAGFMEQRPGIAAGQEERLQILEHRGAPGHERRDSIHAHDEPAQVEPMALRHVALGDREEAREPRLRSEEIVEGAVQPAGTVRVGQAVPDREELPIGAIQEGETHPVRQCRRPGRERREPRLQVAPRRRQRQEPLCQRDERAGEVAAVDRRHVPRGERRERPRVVPVQEVSFMSLEPFHGRDRAFEAREHLLCRDESEVVCRERRQEGHPDVRRGRPVRDRGARVLLIIVRREAMVFLAIELFEVGPRLARDLEEIGPVVFGEPGFRRRERAAEPVGHEGGGDPGGHERDRQPIRGRTHHDRHQEDRDCDEGARDHLRQERARARAEESRRARRLCRGGLPLEEASLGHEEPDERQADGVHRVPRLLCEENERQEGLRGGRGEVRQGSSHVDTNGSAAARDHRAPHQRENERECEDREPEERVEKRGARQDGPGGSEESEEGRRHEAAPQVVENLPAADERKPVSHDAVPGGNEREEPQENLPVAPNPAMLPPRVGQDVRRIVVDDLDVRDESRAGVEALEQVVREERVLRDAALERRDERVHVVQPLPGEDALSEEVLVCVGYGPRIGIHPGVARVDAGEQRVRGAGLSDRDARLEDAVSLGDPPQPRVHVRLVERMREDPDQRAGRSAREPSVGVERQDVADGREDPDVADDLRVARSRGSPEEAIELLDLPALALPAHVEALFRIPGAEAMEEKEPVVFPCRVAVVQVLDPGARRREDFGVVRKRLRLGVTKVAEESEVHVRVQIPESLHFEVVDQIAHRIHARKEGRHDDHRPSALGDAAGKVQPREPARGHEPARDPLNQGDGDLARRQKDQEGRGKLGADGRAARPEGRHRDEDTEKRERSDGREVQGVGPGKKGAPDAADERQAERHVRLEVGPAPADEVIAHVCDPFLRARALCGPPGAGDGAERHADLRLACGIGQLLDRVAVEVPALEVHTRINSRRVTPQNLLDEAHTLDVTAPVHRRNEAQARDGVRHGRLLGREPLMLRPYRVFRGRPVFGEAPRQFGTLRGEARIELAHVGEKLSHKGRVQDLRERHGAIGALEAGPDLVRGAAPLPPREKAVREASEILEQRQLQDAGPGPQLADRERCHGLIRLQKTRQALEVEPSVPGTDELDRHGVQPRRPGMLAGSQLREFAVVAWGQIVANGSGLGLEQMEIVEQPLRGGRERLTSMDVVGEREVRAAQPFHVPLEAVEMGPAAPFRFARQREVGRQRRRAFFERFKAEDLPEERGSVPAYAVVEKRCLLRKRIPELSHGIVPVIFVPVTAYLSRVHRGGVQRAMTAMGSTVAGKRAGSWR